MTTLSIAEARNGLAEAINRVAYGGERVVFARRGKPVAALVSASEHYLSLTKHQACTISHYQGFDAHFRRLSNILPAVGSVWSGPINR
jgi:prevent-host-death family protein